MMREPRSWWELASSVNPDKPSEPIIAAVDRAIAQEDRDTGPRLSSAAKLNPQCTNSGVALSGMPIWLAPALGQVSKKLLTKFGSKAIKKSAIPGISAAITGMAIGKELGRTGNDASKIGLLNQAETELESLATNAYGGALTASSPAAAALLTGSDGGQQLVSVIEALTAKGAARGADVSVPSGAIAIRADLPVVLYALGKMFAERVAMDHLDGSNLAALNGDPMRTQLAARCPLIQVSRAGVPSLGADDYVVTALAGGLWDKIKSVGSKVASVVSKVAPVVSKVASLVPGVGTVISAGANLLGKAASKASDVLGASGGSESTGDVAQEVVPTSLAQVATNASTAQQPAEDNQSTPAGPTVSTVPATSSKSVVAVEAASQRVLPALEDKILSLPSLAGDPGFVDASKLEELAQASKDVASSNIASAAKTALAWSKMITDVDAMSALPSDLEREAIIHPYALVDGHEILKLNVRDALLGQYPDVVSSSTTGAMASGFLSLIPRVADLMVTRPDWLTNNKETAKQKQLDYASSCGLFGDLNRIQTMDAPAAAESLRRAISEYLVIGALPSPRGVALKLRKAWEKVCPWDKVGIGTLKIFEKAAKTVTKVTLGASGDVDAENANVSAMLGRLMDNTSQIQVANIVVSEDVAAYVCFVLGVGAQYMASQAEVAADVNPLYDIFTIGNQLQEVVAKADSALSSEAGNLISRLCGAAYAIAQGASEDIIDMDSPDEMSGQFEISAVRSTSADADEKGSKSLVERVAKWLKDRPLTTSIIGGIAVLVGAKAAKQIVEGLQRGDDVETISRQVAPAVQATPGVDPEALLSGIQAQDKDAIISALGSATWSGAGASSVTESGGDYVLVTTSWEG